MIIPNVNANVYVVEYAGPGKPTRQWPVVAWDESGSPYVAITGQPRWVKAETLPDFSYHGLLVVDQENVEGSLDTIRQSLWDLTSVVNGGLVKVVDKL